MTPLLLVLLGCSSKGSTRIVAVGDLHGDLDNALDVLRLTEVIDEDGRWSGGKTILVQTGDVTDRGPDSKKLLDLLMDLQQQAEQAGGRVVPLLGNHEVMNLQGDWRYVDPGDVEQFGGEPARRAAFAAEGRYGLWLSTLDVCAQVEDTVFCHGGLHPRYAAFGLESLNQQARRTLFSPDAGGVHGSSGPTWFRGYANDDEAVACPLLEQTLAAIGAKRMVVGHSTRSDGRVTARCGGRLTVIDIGISDHYGAHYGAWEWVDGDARALYPDGPVDLPDPS